MAGNANCTGVFDPNAIYEEAGRYILGIDADGSTTASPSPRPATRRGTGTSTPSRRPRAASSSTTPTPVSAATPSTWAPTSSPGFLESRAHASTSGDVQRPAAAGVVGDLPTTGGHAPTAPPPRLGAGHVADQRAALLLHRDGLRRLQLQRLVVGQPVHHRRRPRSAHAEPQPYTGVPAACPSRAPERRQHRSGQRLPPAGLEYRDGYAWSVSTIACNPGGGTVNCLRWVKVNSGHGDHRRRRRL
jgi:hypothetical protein